MAYKIVLDAGHGGEDPGAVYKDRQEMDDTLRLTMAVGDILEKNGVDVVYTRTTDVYQTPFQKARIANEEGADFFISFHRNSSPSPNQYSGVEALVYDKSGIKLEMAENIVNALEKVGFRNLGVKARPGLVVLRRTRMPAVLVEAGFLNTDADNQLFDDKFDEIAQAIASAIMETLDIGTESGETGNGMQEDSDSVFYRVQVGAFRDRQNADNLNYELEAKGYPSFIMAGDGLYRVQVGAFRQLDNAVAMERRLRRDGYNTMLTTR